MASAKIKKILVALDGSKNSIRGSDKISLARVTNASNDSKVNVIKTENRTFSLFEISP